MDRFDAMKVFSRVVEQRSFTLTAQDLGLPRSTVTDVVKALEARLGVQLLHRTTRHVSPTLDGEAYYQRCVTLLADIEEAESAFDGARPKGLLRVEVQGTLARHFIMPNLPDFFRAYPEVELSMSEVTSTDPFRAAGGTGRAGRGPPHRMVDRPGRGPGRHPRSRLGVRTPRPSSLNVPKHPLDKGVSLL